MRTIRIIKLWYYGRIKLAKRMKAFNINARFYFSYYGEYPRSFLDINEFWEERRRELHIR